MTTYQYCTPQWLEKSFELYQDNQAAQQKMKKLTTKMGYLVRAEPKWGIDQDIYFWVWFEKGKMTRLELVSKERAQKESQYILAATPQTWKKILRKEKKFITDFMLGNIKLDQGSKIGVMSVAPHANDMVASLTAVDLEFPDELASEGFEAYHANMKNFRQDLGV